MSQIVYERNLARGALFMAGSALAFALMGAAVKVASRDVPNATIVFVRSLVALMLLLPWLLRHGPRALATRHLGGHLVRGLAGVAAMATFFFVIARMRLADAVLLNQSFPLFLPLAERVWLREPVPPRVWRAIFVGFAGVLLILKPGSGLFAPAALVGVASAMLAAVAQVGIRKLTTTEPVVRIVFYFGLIACGASALALPWVWRTPSPTAWLALFAAGLFSTIGQLALTRAYAHAPAALVGPFTYMGVVFAALLDWWLWRVLPDLLFVPGAMLVAVAGGSLLRHTRAAVVGARGPGQDQRAADLGG